MTLFQRLGRLCARQRWRVVAVWAVLALAALPLAPQAPGALSPGGFSLDDLEAAQARRTLESEIGLPPSALVIVVRSETDARAGDPDFELSVATALAGVATAEHVTGVLPHTLAPNQVSEDGRTVYQLVSLDLPPDASPDAIRPVEAAIRDVPGYTTLLAGGPAFYGDIQTVSEQDLQRSELIGLPLAAVALLVVFGSVVAAGVPIVVGGLAVLIALAVIFLIASVTPMSIFVLNLATLLGFGLGVDYALLLSSRFREELARGNGGRLPDGSTDQAAVEAAVVATVGTAGRAAFFSGITVLLGLIGLILFDFMVLRSVGVAGAVVVAFAVIAAVTLLPAVLSIIGPRIDLLRLPRLRRAAPKDVPRESGTGTTRPGGWARLARWVMDRPVQVFLPTLGLLIVLGLPFLHVRFNAPDATILPADVPSRQAYDLLVEEFQEGEFAPLLLAVRTQGAATTPENVGALYDYSRLIAADPRVARVDSIVDIDPRLDRQQYQLILSNAAGPADRYVADRLRRTTSGDLTTFSVVTWYGPNRTEARALVDALRDPGSALAPPAGIQVLVGGGAAEVKDVVDRIGADFPRSAIFILISTYLVLFMLLRSVVLPLKALIINALSILASFGALVWIFQDGNLSALLGFQPLGFVETTLPVILFCVLFGLSMDYEVFLLSRMKEAYDRTGDNREAVAQGLERSGRIVTSAALIVVVVAGSFAFAEVVLIKAVGLGVAIAVALDATIVRALLVPSTMRLLGDRNWWMPARLRRWIGTRLPVIEGAAFGGTALQALVLSVVAALLLAGCSPSGRLLANEPVVPAPVPVPTPAVNPVPDPQAVVLPRDDGTHDELTEWWYYTGHLSAEDGHSFGFEYVIFRAERGAFPVAWASHLAVTDEDADRFLYDQRSEIGPQVDRSRGAAPVDGSGSILDLAIRGEVGPGIPAADAVPWTMSGGDGQDQLSALGRTGGADFGLDLALDDADRSIALHDQDGYIDFGPAGGSYYYSRTKMDAAGTLYLDGQELAVEGSGWFDHQWGDFIAVGAGGWDWFAVNLDDGTDFTLSLVRDAEGGYPLVYGTLVRPGGEVEHLPREAFSVTVTDDWTSGATGATYPAGWRIEMPAEGLVVDLAPTVAAQELDTRPTTGVVYWEGSQVVTATREGVPLGGEAYVELTGYGPGPSSQAP